ncbi:MAG: hypothetical protein F4X97_12670 [Boseongicola sp. SB0662_bin_57]|nr:hypothetical protein [Boseongicola sp. SB0662_bin_57]
MSDLVPKKIEDLPPITNETDQLLTQVTSTLGVPRDVLPEKAQIDHIWENLPKLLSKIPAELRDESMIRLCIAVSVGLFDSAINYVWNSTIVELRHKVIGFGLPIVAQLTSKSLDDEKLEEMMDHDLLKLCLELNLIAEDGYFKLDQCRAIRNSFSAAHPAVGALDEYEVVNFISRCARAALSDVNVPAGVNFNELITAIKSAQFNNDQKTHWTSAIQGTHSAQRELIATALHGMYCDETLGQSARANCTTLFSSVIGLDGIPSAIIDQHQTYVGKGEESKASASRDFFTKFGMLDLLSEAEKHSIVSTACDRLYAAHKGMNNFYNEPPFAARLQEIVEASVVPDSVRLKFVETVVSCAIGNQFGVSWAAAPHYKSMIKEFSPKALEMMFSIPNSKTLVANKIKSFSACRKRYAELVGLLPGASIPTALQTAYNSWMDELAK